MNDSGKAQRIRDPLHNLIEFGTDQFEQTLWQVINTQPFQRLRRIRQLGFSEFVFPGATHTRFAHSVGVFHTARQLIQMIRQNDGDLPHQAKVALAAALVHDVGHGMFSHSFEEVGKALELPMADHVKVSEQLIREGEIAEALRNELGSGFPNDVAEALKKAPRNMYDSVVSSQFDADRLDYMQRDRMMTGVHSSGIDATWLIANLEIGTVQRSADGETSGSIETLVLGPKAFHAAENYVLSLFQLYPNIYLHKTTRAAEKLFSCLMFRIFKLSRAGHKGKIGLPNNHPIRRFVENPSSLDNVLALDDTVFWGALPLMAEAKDPLVRDCAKRLRERHLPKCIDIRRLAEEHCPVSPGMSMDERQTREAELRLACKEIAEAVRKFAKGRAPNQPQILVDVSKRTPYKKFQESKTPLDQIRIRLGETGSEDMASLSPAVENAQTFEICRAYHIVDDTEGRSMIENIVRTNLRERRNG